jgi:D-alanine-D-alanine ligase
MKRACFLFGGRSYEHGVSITSMRSVLTSYASKKFEVTIAGLDFENRLQFFSKEEFLERFQPYSRFDVADNGSYLEDLKKFDVIFPLMHGDYVEDGSFQGALRLMGVPFVGPSVLSSSLCWDKEVAKRLLVQAGLKVPDWVCIGPYDTVDLEILEKRIGYPCFVKPAASGSSIGVSKVKGREDLIKAIDGAKKFSSKVLVEKAITGIELECAVLGLDNPVVSKVGQVIPKNEFYDYEAKYILSDGASVVAPACIPEKLEYQVRQQALRAFRILECDMMARVDFFYDGTLYVNEINTIPGFTPISLYPKLMNITGVSYTALIDSLLQMALQHHLRKELEVPPVPIAQYPL